MENYLKLSEMASFELKDVNTVSILICYLLHRIDKPIEAEQLFEIAVSTDIINYFFYQDAIDILIKNNSINIETDENDIEKYVLTDKGRLCARKFKHYVPKSFRDKLVGTALKYFAQLKLNNEVTVKYIKLDNGYYVHFRCLDLKNDLIDMKLFAPDLTQAKLIGEKILLNPVGFYSKIINIALGNMEEEYDLTDN
ncbi:MAG: DUF4364 family protein [Clostridiales bacterium]|jgi:hypothetical protein|nr:DUF4364 family protein [Clostridiales bacterium]